MHGQIDGFSPPGTEAAGHQQESGRVSILLPFEVATHTSVYAAAARDARDSRRTYRPQAHIDLLEALYQCFAHVAHNPPASQRLLRLRAQEISWQDCLAILRVEFPAIVAVSPV